MSQRFYSYATGWEWHILQQTTPENMLKVCPDAADWILHLQDSTNSGILMTQLNNKAIVVQGKLAVQLSEDKEDVHPFHFWMTEKKLITYHQDNRIAIRLQNLNYTAVYEQCQTAPEALCAMINILLEHLHISLDQFQTRLGTLEKNVRMHNRKDLLDEIIERRYELLQYSHLYLPYREFEGILKESFIEQIEHSKSFVRLQHRFERLNTLLKHYAVEIDTLLSVDDAISNMRGNEIIRTLTIFTVLCLPATILGSIWGSNFEWLPFKEDPFGFIYLILTIFAITGFLSFLLWKKGWTGDIISAPKRRRKQNLNSQLPPLALLEQSDIQNEQTEIEPLPPRKHRQEKVSPTTTKKMTLNQLEERLIAELPKRSKRHK